jgi:hypothetical protein
VPWMVGRGRSALHTPSLHPMASNEVGVGWPGWLGLRDERRWFRRVGARRRSNRVLARGLAACYPSSRADWYVVALACSTIEATILSRAEVSPRGVASSQGSSTATPPNSAIEADVALAALGTTQLNASRWADLGSAFQSRVVMGRLARRG